MKAIPYRLTLLEPLLATRIAGDPNSAVSYPYVPGSMVRGAMVAAYMQEKSSKSLDAGDDEVQRFFFDGRTRYLNAYPADAEGHRTLPTPRSLFHVKGEKSPLYDFAHKVVYEMNGAKAQFVTAARESQPFCWIDSDTIYFLSPQRRINVHTFRDRVRGRATEDGGAIFQYDALEQGQAFSGWVLVETDEDADLLVSLLKKTQRLGGSSNSGYGRVAVEVEAPLDISGRFWREVPDTPEAIALGEVFIVTLLSDVLVRDLETGSYTWDIKPALEKVLGVAIEYVEALDEEEQRSVWRMEEVGGFNRTWGLPLPQAQAIAAGSVFVFRARQSISKEAIATVEWRGIGERRAEGFGRLIFGWQQETKLDVIEAPKAAKSRPSVPQLPAGPATTLAMQMAERMLRRELDHKLRKTVFDIRVPDGPSVSNAQLSRMRVIIREALSGSDIRRVQQYLINIDQRRSVRDQFERTRVNGERLSSWLKSRLEHPEDVWTKIGAQNLSKRIGTNVVAATQGNEALAREYTLRLIDGVLARLAKERRKEDGGDR